MKSKELAELVTEALEDLKGVNIEVMDVSEMTSVTDYMLVASGRSARQVKALADNVISQAKSHGQQPLGVEGEEFGEWILVDLGDVVVHVMQPEVRTFYQLERLWGASDSGARPTSSPKHS
ncbi:MAG: ribosome silencing factor [Gammaproteobacteria bacterium]|nr:MAG: ribosome silencing factor [Gammaproteobacteria bacterium]